MAISPETIALALLCRPDGAFSEVLYDELGVKPNKNFYSLIHTSSQRKAKRFLKTAVASHSALDWELDVALPHGISSLFFSAAMTAKGIVILGMKDGVGTGAMPDGAPTVQGEILGRSLHKLNSQRQARLRVRKRLRSDLQRLTKSAAGPFNKERSDSSLSQTAHPQLLRMLAHDLRNPISGILAASQYLIEDAGPVLDSQQVTLLRSIESSSGLMLKLIEELLEVSSVGTKKPKLQFRSTNLAELVEQSAETHRPMALSRNIQIAIEKTGAVPHVDLDPAKMTRAIDSLLTNAVRASSPGSIIEISLNTLPGRVVISIPVQAGDFAEAASNGQRRARQMQSNSFTLLLTRSIVRGHGGTIRLQNAARRPSYTLSLPRSRR